MDGRYYAEEFFSESLLVPVRFPLLNFCTFWTNRIWQITGKRLKDPTSHEWFIQASFTTRCPKLVFTSAEIYRVIQYMRWETGAGLNPDLMGFGEPRVQTDNSFPLVPWNKSDGRRKVPVSYKTKHQIKMQLSKVPKNTLSGNNTLAKVLGHSSNFTQK